MKVEKLVFGCSDPRLQKKIEKMTKRENISPYCQIFVPGSVKVLFDEDQSVTDYFRSQIIFVCKKFSIDEVILVGHAGCAAYEIEDRECEKDVQFRDLEKANRLIKNELPSIKVTKLWGILDPTKDIITNLEHII